MQFTERKQLAEQEWYKQHPPKYRYASLVVRSVDELFLGIKPQDGDQWGPWRFQQIDLTLQLEGPYETFCREVDLEGLQSPAQIMECLGRAMGKTWGNAEVMGHLLRALHDLAGNRGWWGDPTLNLTERIRSREFNGAFIEVGHLSRNPVAE